MAERDEHFLARWSRRKRAGGASPRITPMVEPATEPEACAPATGEAAPPEPATTGAPRAVPASDEATAAPVAVEDLPDIENLGRGSDYTPFLRKGVPEHLTRQALRKLWRSDPVFANLDGLNDYDEDFAKPFIESAGKAIKTYWTGARDATRKARDATAAATDGSPPAAGDGIEADAAPGTDTDTGTDAGAPPNDDESPDKPAKVAAAEGDDGGGGSRGI